MGGGLGLLPSPLRGGVGGGGRAALAQIAPPRSLLHHPLPTPPPQGGREHTECAEREQRQVFGKESRDDYAGPTSSIIANSSGRGAMRSAAAPAAASGSPTCREMQICTGASAASRMPAREAQSR